METCIIASDFKINRMSLPEGRKRIMQNILDLYRTNLRDNLDLDSIILDKYIKAVNTLKLKLTDHEHENALQEIAAERERQKQLKLF